MEKKNILWIALLDEANWFFFNSSSVTFTALFTHDLYSSDKAFNTKSVWILPDYARYLSHEPRTNVTNPYPGEYNFEVGYKRIRAESWMIDRENKIQISNRVLACTH